MVTVPTATSTFPSEAWWAALGASITADIDEARASTIEAPVLTAGTDLDSVTYSSLFCVLMPGGAHANAPDTVTGVLRTVFTSSSLSVQEWTSAHASARAYTRAYQGGNGWSPWARTDAAAATVDFATNLEVSATKAVRANDGRLADARNTKVTTLTTGDLNEVLVAGRYAATSLALINLPSGRVGILDVTTAGANMSQRFEETAGGSWPTVEWTRRRINGTWTVWALGGWQGPFVSPSADFDTIRTPGAWPVQATNHPNQPALNTGCLEVLPAIGLVIQRFTTWETVPRVFTRRATSATAWSAWAAAPSTAAITANTSQIASLATRVGVLEGGGGGGSGTGPSRPLLPLTPTVVTKPANDIMTEMSSDRLRGWNQGGTSIRETRDDGVSWVTRYTFSGMSIEMIQPLANGELIVATTDGSSMRRIYRTTGIAGSGAVTVTEVIAPRVPYVKYTSAWSVSTYKSIVLVAEYGPKVPTWDGQPITAGDNARFVHLSLDSGVTFSVVFDLNAYLTGRGAPLDQQHLHGVAWDPYWDRIWVSFGDAADGIVYSDDLGATWSTAVFVGTSPSPTQVVGIVPLADAVLFGGDTTPQVQRILRAPGKNGPLVLDVAWEMPGGHLMQATHIHRGEAGTVAYMGFGSEGVAAPSFVVAARSGTDVVKVWQDSADQPAGYGVRSVVGPTLRGQLIIGSNDLKVGGQWSQITGNAPGY